CPNCNEEFLSIEAVILHLNSQSTCWPHESRPQQFPIPPGLRGSHSSASSTTGSYHPRSGYVFGVGNNLFDRLQEDQYEYRRKINTYYPFHDEGEWELARFLVENLTQTQIDKFLKLKWHEYGDYMSADMAWKIQDHLPVGATQVPIILGSDKTPVTRTTGGLEMHLLFITIGNLDSEVRSKATLRAWHCIAYMPIAKFRVHPDYQSILQARLWHRCVDLVCANLKVAAKDGCFMPDPSRYICYVFTPLVSHVCDLPEATMIATVSKSASPITMATQANFGDGVLYPPRTGQHTLQLVYEISKEVNPWDLDKFQKAAKVVHLSGVHMPYWRDWTFACPSVFLTGEVLHTCIKFFADHPLNWIKETVGKPELNARFMVQHKRVGTRHFTKGVTHVNQMTGREH
ncbi:hypothetical protein EV424DRAFT_1330170, partial [Suillus variegatus]